MRTLGESNTLESCRLPTNLRKLDRVSSLFLLYFSSTLFNLVQAKNRHCYFELLEL